MSNTGEATTTARDEEAQGNQAETAENQAQADTTATTDQSPEIHTPTVAGQGAPQNQTATGQQAETGPAASSNQAVEASRASTGGAQQQATDVAATAPQPKPDVSDQDYQELLPKLMNHFHNNREELARAIGLHRSTVDRWLNGKSRPNNSTVLRMRRLVQERGIE
jgi:DNA-binding transcriptional regulator YiaG